MLFILNIKIFSVLILLNIHLVMRILNLKQDSGRKLSANKIMHGSIRRFLYRTLNATCVLHEN